MNTNPNFDLFIIGGGVNGCGIACDAAGRGLSVCLAEQDDLAQGTSSASSKLIHGGLRYLEHYEFGLVRESLIEREILLQKAPHIIWPMRFVLPHHTGLRPAWLMRLGLFLYDHIGGRKLLPATRSLNLLSDPAGQPLSDEFSKGFEYSDCWVDDARLVVLNALHAKQNGADVRTRTRCTGLERSGEHWQITLEDTRSGETSTISARAVVNAAGPWVDVVLRQTGNKRREEANVRLVRGSHVVVPKLYDHDRAYIFQNSDGRIMFSIPYEQHYTLLGTTDADHNQPLDSITISEEETQYICDSASVYFKQPVSREDIVWSYAGVRSLYDDGASEAQETTRDYVLKVFDEAGAVPLLNIFGGKITTYRHLAEDVLSKLKPYLPEMKEAWTKSATLPGGEFAVDEVDSLINRLQRDYAFVDPDWAASLIRRYGARAWDLLGAADSKAALGKDFGGTLSEQEIQFLIDEEWAQSAEDILWRRSKLGLAMTPEQRQSVEEWLAPKGDNNTML